MKVQPITTPLRGERVLGVSPPISPNADPGWQRRLNLYTGRTLSDTALTAEQVGRAGRAALRGQLISPGVVSGLEIGLEKAIGLDGKEQFFIRLSPGFGIAASGEDVAIPQPLRANVSDIAVIAPIAPPADQPPEPRNMLSLDGPPLVRALGATLGQRLQNAEALPPVGILVLQPVVSELIGIFDPRDQCERDTQNDAYEDWQLADGCRLVLYAWPNDWMPLPPRDLRWRNTLAYAIYDATRRYGPGRPLPWEEYGVPVGLLAGDDTWQPLFLDRYAVVRTGGKPRTRTRLVTNAGDVFLWQARIQQLVEHLADAVLEGNTTNAIASQIRFLPPSGLLPHDAIDLTTQHNLFFPNYFTIEAAPVPLEQLDIMLEASASLMAYDLQAPDHVQVLVPVPQRVYEPRLLVREQIDPLFQAAIDDSTARRTRWLQTRENLRGKQAVLQKAVNGNALTRSLLIDPGRLEDEGDYTSLTFEQLIARRTSLATGLHWQEISFREGARHVDTNTVLFAYVYIDPDNPPSQIMLEFESNNSWEHRAYWGASRINLGQENSPSRHFVGPLPATGRWLRLTMNAEALNLRDNAIDAMRFTLFDGRVAWGVSGNVTNESEDAWFFSTDLGDGRFTSENDELTVLRNQELLAPFEDAAGTFWDTNETPLLHVHVIDDLRGRVQASIASDTLAKFDELGLTAYIALLQEKIDRADDSINFSYLRAQTDIYRVRQLMLGNVEATRLAVSPGLASVAQGISASATQQQISDFFKQIKSSTPAAAPKGATLAAQPENLIATAPMATAFIKPNTLLFSNDFTVSNVNQFTVPQEIKSSATAFLKKESAVQAILGTSLQTSATVGDIVDQAPLPGLTEIRNTNVAERIKVEPATEARNYSLASKADVVKGFKGLDLNLSAVKVPGLPEEAEPVSLNAVDLTKITNESGQRLTDEASYFYRSVDLLDHTIAILRQVEGQVARYRQLITDCRSVIDQVQALTSQVVRRLQVVGEELAESRQDVSAARALLADEEARITAINDRRALVLTDHVHFLAYQRPRVTDMLAATPSRPLDPAVTESPLPIFQGNDDAIPSELRELIKLLREAPVIWFPTINLLLNRLNKLEHLTAVVQSANLRAQVQAATTFTRAVAVSSGTYASQLGRVFSAQQQTVAQYRVKATQIDIAQFVKSGWQSARDEAADLVSIGDLIDGEHGRSDVSRQASDIVDRILRVSSSLHTELAAVLPAIRLEWAERLGQYDGPVNLRNLGGLPRWNEIDIRSRREMQSLTDWLYQRVDPTQTDAVALINDLVRICVLLASHAPVNRILAGALTRETALTAGRRIDLTVFEPLKVRVGMKVLIYNQQQVVAHAVVEDLRSGMASVAVQKLLGQASTAANYTLAAGAKVQFVDNLPVINKLRVR